MTARSFKAYHFFAGGGFVEYGMPKDKFEVLYANDFDEMKCASHRYNLPLTPIYCENVSNVRAGKLPGVPDLVWASPPCQDISLAGKGAGLRGAKSSAFFPFFEIMRDLVNQRRAPKVIVIENVAALATSNKGADLALIVKLFDEIGYQALCTKLNARWFVPQSRERCFIILWPKTHNMPLDPQKIRQTGPGMYEFVPRFSMFTQYGSKTFFTDSWNDPDCKLEWLEYVTGGSLDCHEMPVGEVAKGCNHPEWIHNAAPGQMFIGFRRTRKRDNATTTFFELTKSGPMGCLRTYSGGSSVPTLFRKTTIGGIDVYPKLPVSIAMIAMGFEPTTLKINLELTSGHPNRYKLPENYSDAFHIMGDAVVPQCVTFLMSEVVYPLLTELRQHPRVPAMETV